MIIVGDSMNAEAQSLNDNTIDTAKILKDFVNKLNDLIYKLNELDYDTKELYKVHDMLRYEVLNEEYVKKLCDNHLLDDTAKKIRVYDSILTDLSDQLDELHSKHFKKKDEAIYFTINKPTRDRRDPISKRSAIFHTISVLLSMALVAGVGHELKKESDELKIESLDTENVSSAQIDI